MASKGPQNRSIKEQDRLLWEEARLNLLAEADGKKLTIGAMQKAHPDAYRQTRDLLLEMARTVPPMVESIAIAEKLSEMLHSDDEGLSSIQEFVADNPPNALTLARLIALERAREPGRIEKTVGRVESDKALDENRGKGTQTTKERAEKRKQDLRQMYIDVRKANPSWGRDQYIQYLRKQPAGTRYKPDGLGRMLSKWDKEISSSKTPPRKG